MFYRPRFDYQISNLLYYGYYYKTDTSFELCQKKNKFEWSELKSTTSAAAECFAAAFTSQEMVEVNHSSSSRNYWNDIRLDHPLYNYIEVLLLRGEYLLSFTVLSTVLEHVLINSVSASSILLMDSLALLKKNFVIHPKAMACLEWLLLPTGLNLRNLVWHGFINPVDFPKCFAYLLLIFVQPEWIFPSSSFTFLEMIVCHPPSLTIRSSSKWKVAALHLITNLRPKSEMVKALCRDYIRGDVAAGIFRCLPILEQRLRHLYLASNSLSLDYQVARHKEYYTTLDGFGQREVHHVVLDPFLSASDNKSNRNALYDKLPKGVMHLLIDLFLMPAGPTLRASACHGTTYLKYLLVESYISDTASKFLLLTAAVELEDGDFVGRDLVYNYQSEFHPQALLNTGIRECHGLIEELKDLCDLKLSFEGGKVLVFKENKLVAALRENLSSKLQAQVEELEKELQDTNHFSETEIDLERIIVEQEMMCKVATLKACVEGLTSLKTTIKHQMTNVLERTARTSQRKAFLNSLVAAPALIKLWSYVITNTLEEEGDSKKHILNFAQSLKSRTAYHQALELATPFLKKRNRKLLRH